MMPIELLDASLGPQARASRLRPAILAAPVEPTDRLGARILAFAVALLAGFPALFNLLATYVADGNSTGLMIASAAGCLVLLGLAALRIGMPAPLRSRSSPHMMAFAMIAALFWAHFLAVIHVSPSPLEMMRIFGPYAVAWIVLPMFIIAAYHRHLDLGMLVRSLIVVATLYVVGLATRYFLGLGLYHSGRWHAGESLEAIRSGRFTAAAIWIYGVSLLLPRHVVPPALKLLAMAMLPLGLFMLVASNARGPWLAFLLAVLLSSGPLLRASWRRLESDARLMVPAALLLVAAVGFIVWQLAGLESDLRRLVDPSHDGGSSRTRVSLMLRHIRLIEHTPFGLISGFGYAHGMYYPHNIVLEALTTGGLLSVALLLGCAGVAVHAWLTAPAANRGALGLIGWGIFVMGFVGSQVSGSIANETMPWYGMLLVLIQRERLRLVPAAPRDEGSG